MWESLTKLWFDQDSHSRNVQKTFGDLPGKSGGTKGMKIGIVSKRKNDLTSEKGCIKHIELCWELQGIENLTSKMRNLSGCAGW